ncbi:MAG TPA: hypothetical protein VEC16_04545 [Alphaproteobacteria bacterium]|nr:hypothetical protein [Alphaproteobacteria bacterium]
MKNKIGIIGAFLLALMVSCFAVSAASVTIRPDGSGTHSSWALTSCGAGASSWNCVDEIGLNTSDNLSTTIQGAAVSFSFSNLALDPSATIDSVTLNYWGRRVSSTRFEVEPLIVSNGSNYTGGITNLTSVWSLYSKIYTTNPATGTAWTISSVDALEAGLKASSGSNRGGGLAQMHAVVNYTIPNSCTDSDGGIVLDVKGNVTGFASSNKYTHNDFCETSVILTEWYCSGTSPAAINTSCATNTTTTCSAGRCV